MANWESNSHEISFQHVPRTLACWNGDVAVGLQSHSSNIIILNIASGKQTSLLDGHSAWVRSLNFSADGGSLVSGGDDGIVNLWDIQTRRITKSFLGHSSSITSVSISPDCTTVASGSWDGMIGLWDISEEGHQFIKERHQFIKQHNQRVNVVSFSPKNPQQILSASEDGTVRYQKIGDSENDFEYKGYHAAFSASGNYFLSCGRSVVTIRDSSSRETKATLHTTASSLDYCCFSPDEVSVAGATSKTIYIWNITSSDPSPIRTLTGHTGFINSLTFSSSLISICDDGTIKFWGTDALSPGPLETSPAPIESISVQADDDIAISTDLAGAVRVWNISTGCCEGPYETPAKRKRDVRLVNDKLIAIWYDWKIGAPGKVHVLDVKAGETLQVFGQSQYRILDLRISGDGSMVFLLDYQSIKAWSISTGDPINEIRHQGQNPSGLIVNGSRVWLSFSDPITQKYLHSSPKGWEFETSKPPSVLLSNTSPDRPSFIFANGTPQINSEPIWIEDHLRRQIFCLPKRFSTSITASHCNKWCFVIGYHSGKVLILDFRHIYPKHGFIIGIS